MLNAPYQDELQALGLKSENELVGQNRMRMAYK